MKLKRVLSGIIGLPIVALILIYGNIYVIDVVFSVVAIIAILPLHFNRIYGIRKGSQKR